MQWLTPSYYPAFSCIVGACRHNCCIGWEIDIDEKTLALYRSLDGKLGNRLAKHISMEDTPHFVLTPQRRCPFLNQDNLCDIISDLGEDALCQICADHPRFRNDWSDRTELGLGLCCEAAGRLILGAADPVSLIPLWDDGEPSEPPSPEERALRRLRDETIAILQDRNAPIPMRVRTMLTHCRAILPDRSPAQWADTFLSLERLDEAWTDRLIELKHCPVPPPDDLPLRDTVWEQLLVYFVYRHFPAALNDGDAAGKAAFAALSWQTLRALCALEYQKKGNVSLDDLVELCRLYSSEIEYSDENIERLYKQK